jgi:hypothetical protein
MIGFAFFADETMIQPDTRCTHVSLLQFQWISQRRKGTLVHVRNALVLQQRFRLYWTISCVLGAALS